MLRWNMDDLPAFVASVERGGISAAAQHLGMPKSTVSTMLSRLEEGLGLRLLERNSRTVRLTAEGESFYRQAAALLEQAAQANAIMSGLREEPSGRLTVALPIAFTRDVVAPRLPEFFDLYPKVDLHLMVSGHTLDILRQPIDLAVVVGALEDSDFVVRPLYQGRLLWVASPDYARCHALPASLPPAEILPHIRICENRYGLKRFPVRLGDHRLSLNLAHGPAHVNDPIVVRKVVEHGGGLSLLAALYALPALRQGSLVEVLPDLRCEATAAALSAVYPSRRHLASKTRVFLDFLIGLCRDIEETPLKGDWF